MINDMKNQRESSGILPGRNAMNFERKIKTNLT